MVTQEINREIPRDEPRKGAAPTLNKKTPTFSEQMAEDMADYHKGDERRSAVMLDYLASLQEEKTKPH